MAATARYVEFKEGVEPRFIHEPATWINQERWTDEIVSGNGHARPTQVKDLGNGSVEVDGRQMERENMKDETGKQQTEGPEVYHAG